MAKIAKRHKKPNKRSLAAKARWAKRKAANDNSPMLTMADYAEKILKPMAEQKTLRIKLPQEYNLHNPSPQTRLDNIFDKFEQAINQTIAKLKATF